jgi:hypothetical protein
MADQKDLSGGHAPATGENSQCGKCGQGFHCGLNDTEPCWCASDFPQIISADVGASCLCPRCLAGLIAERETAS